MGERHADADDCANPLGIHWPDPHDQRAQSWPTNTASSLPKWSSRPTRSPVNFSMPYAGMSDGTDECRSRAGRGRSHETGVGKRLHLVPPRVPSSGKRATRTTSVGPSRLRERAGHAVDDDIGDR